MVPCHSISKIGTSQKEKIGILDNDEVTRRSRNTTTSMTRREIVSTKIAQPEATITRTTTSVQMKFAMTSNIGNTCLHLFILINSTICTCFNYSAHSRKDWFVCLPTKQGSQSQEDKIHLFFSNVFPLDSNEAPAATQSSIMSVACRRCERESE